MKRIISLALAAMIILCAVSCTSLESTAEEKKVVMTVAGYDVAYEVFRYAALNCLDEALADGKTELTDEFIASEAGKALEESVKSEAAERLKTIYGVFALGEKYGIDRNSEAIAALVDSNMESNEAQYESKKDFKASLTESHMTKNVLRVTEEFTVVYDEIYNEMLECGDIVTDRDGLNKIFASDELVRIKELCFSTERHSIEECRTLAAAAYGELKAGADFDAYVDAHGESLTMFKNHDGHYITRGIWEKSLEDAAFALSVGEMSEPIETSDGVRILLRAEKSGDYIEENFDTLRDTYEEGVFRRAVEDAVSEAGVVPAQGFAEISVFEMRNGK